MIGDENKHDGDKVRLDLVEPSFIEAVGRIRTYGVKKIQRGTELAKSREEQIHSGGYEALRGISQGRDIRFRKRISALVALCV